MRESVLKKRILHSSSCHFVQNDKTSLVRPYCRSVLTLDAYALPMELTSLTLKRFVDRIGYYMWAWPGVAL